MAVTDSDGATAAQKCDPYAVDFEKCESFLRGEDDVVNTRNVMQTDMMPKTCVQQLYIACVKMSF